MATIRPAVIINPEKKAVMAISQKNEKMRHYRQRSSALPAS
jgi:hypothetical protein